MSGVVNPGLFLVCFEITFKLWPPAGAAVKPSNCLGQVNQIMIKSKSDEFNCT